jgi:hypothetical protein
VKRLITVGLASVALLALAGCDENYSAVSNSKLVVAEDLDGNVDGRNIRVACAEAGFTAPVRIVGKYQADDGKAAVVECR